MIEYDDRAQPETRLCNLQGKHELACWIKYQRYWKIAYVQSR